MSGAASRQALVDLVDWRRRVGDLYRTRGADAVVEFRRRRDELMRDHPQSPLPAADRNAFTGLSYFPPNPATCSAVASWVCGRCGKPMQASPHNGRRRYACAKGTGAVDHCGGTFIMADPLEGYVRDHVVGLLLNQTDHMAEGGDSGSQSRAEVERQLEAD